VTTSGKSSKIAVLGGVVRGEVPQKRGGEQSEGGDHAKGLARPTNGEGTIAMSDRRTKRGMKKAKKKKQKEDQSTRVGVEKCGEG